VARHGGKRPGAGRPPKTLSEHLRDGTFRPRRHAHLLQPAEAEKRALSAKERRLALVSPTHDDFSRDQLYFAHRGPWVGGHPDNWTDEERARVEAWEAWNAAHGLRWRLQNRCPRVEDEIALSHELGISLFEVEERLAELVETAVLTYDRSIPDPPGWAELERRAQADRAALRWLSFSGRTAARLRERAERPRR